MYRILVFGMTNNPGGVESFLINYFRYIDRTKIHFDFLCNTYEKVAYEDELLRLGGRIFHITARSNNFILYRKEMKAFFREHGKEYHAIWVNVSSLANIDYLVMAKQYGIGKRIIHSHNSRNMDNRVRGILHKWNRGRVDRYATDFWACSNAAAEWFYNGRILQKAVFIHNAIDVRAFSYDEEKRNVIREKIGCKNAFVIGNIGRLHFQKNQNFILDVFKVFLNICPDSRLILIGQGADEQILKEKADMLRISSKVLFMGIQQNVKEWLSAFDLFFFPSKFEGFSIAALEAQANGVPVLASEKVIPDEIKINDNFVFYSLDELAEKWAEKLAEMKMKATRECMDTVQDAFIRKGYEVITEVTKIEQLLMR